MLSTYLPEKYSPQAVALLEEWTRQQTQIAAPALIKYEFVSALRKSVARKVISADYAANSRDELLAHEIHLMLDDDLLRRAYELATQLNRPNAYDAQYLAVAERLNCEFWTADQRLFNAVNSHLAWVKWVGSFTPETGNPNYITP